MIPFVFIFAMTNTMPLAVQDVPWVAIAAGVACVLILGVLAVGLFRGYERLARRSLEKAYAGLEIRTQPEPGDVVLVYHTYHGFIAWFTQTSHCVTLPPDHARTLLGRLLRFNLTWGLTSYGMFFVPFLAVFSYMAQRRAITRQQAGASFTQASDEAIDYVPQVTREDVLRVVRRDFQADDHDVVLRMLDLYGTESWHPERDRVHLAILKLGDGDVDRVREQVETAKIDFRDVLAAAEYPGYADMGFVGVDRLSPEQVEQLQKDDWDQYYSWLHRA